MELREIMAELRLPHHQRDGRTVECLDTNEATSHWKASGVDLTTIFHKPDVGEEVGAYCQKAQDHGLDQPLDNTHLLKLCEPAIKRGEKGRIELPIINVNRVVGTITGSEVTRHHGGAGLPEDTIYLKFKGSAGQSFAAFAPPGMTFELEGDANDYVGKGLSGAKIIIYPPAGSKFKAEENIIIGNVAFYGATPARPTSTASPASGSASATRVSSRRRRRRRPRVRIHDRRSGDRARRDRA
jgi:hypothetical protein